MKKGSIRKIIYAISLFIILISALVIYLIWQSNYFDVKKDNNVTTDKETKDDVKIVNKEEIMANDIAKFPMKYYGKSVNNYVVHNNVPLKFQIFHSDGKNIYLIANYYIPTDYIPRSRNGCKAVDGMNLDLLNVRRDYLDIDSLDNNPAKKWLEKYYKSGYDCLEDRMREIRYLLDIEVWNVLKSDKAEYVIASPTVEMYIDSYNKTHEDKKIDLKLSEKEYLFKWSTESEDKYKSNIEGLDKKEFNNLYIINNPDDRASIVLVSYEGEGANETRATLAADFTGKVGWSLYNCMAGLRPIICLNSDVVLVENDDGSFMIK